MRQIVYLLVFFLTVPFAFAQGTRIEEVQPPRAEQMTLPEQSQPPTQETKPKDAKKRFSLFKKNETEQKYVEEKRGLWEKYEKEKQEARDRYLKGREEARKKKEAEREEIRGKEEAKRNKSITIEEKKKEQEELVEDLIKKRDKEIKVVHKLKRHVEIITSENDPLYIAEAVVLDARTSFSKIKGVELKYKLKVYNQTPKIINSILVIWERKIPFSDSQTILKESKISKPLIPYEKRTIEYNDLDSTRQGEIYKVKVANVIFEDGTQWKNPSS